MPRGTIILSIFDWWCHSHGHSDMQLARVLAGRGPVLFVNSIGMRFPQRQPNGSQFRRIGRKLRSTARAASRPIPGLDLTVFTPVFWPAYSGLAGRLNQQAARAQIAHVVKRLGFYRPLVIVTLPTFADVALSLDHSVLLYNRSDRHSAYKYCDGDLVSAKEELLLQRSDAVLYASRSLYMAEAARVAGVAALIGHGVDLDHFTPVGSVAPELAGVPHPRVGFFGDLREHAIDFELLASVAQMLPTIQFVLGGSQLDELSALRRLPNVHLLAPCRHEAMPARWRGLDAAILPYRLSRWQEASEPIKLNEIAAVGLPAVGTPLPAFADRAVDVAASASDFAAAICSVLKRQGLPRGFVVGPRSWGAVADDIEHLAASLGAACRSAA